MDAVTSDDQRIAARSRWLKADKARLQRAHASHSSPAGRIRHELEMYYASAAGRKPVTLPALPWAKPVRLDSEPDDRKIL